MKITTIVSIFLCILSGALGVNTVHAQESKYRIEIFKTDQFLRLKEGDKTIKEYRIALGKGGNGTKRKLGDHKTPIGVYKIVDFNEESKFHFFMQLDYPNLLDAWYGYKNNVISANEFKAITTAYKYNKIPPQDTKLGGYIGIHGVGAISDQKLLIHEEVNWTEGCIALTNEQIIELRQFVDIGTKVVINE